MIGNLVVLLGAMEPDGELSGQAYLVLAGVLLLIVGGLTWCFLRAARAANKGADEQRPDEV